MVEKNLTPSPPSIGNAGIQDGGEAELRAVQDPVESGRPWSGLRAVRATGPHLPLMQPPEGPGIKFASNTIYFQNHIGHLYIGQAWSPNRGHGERQQRQYRLREAHEGFPGETGLDGS